jgi:hypothetical protein
MINGRLIVNSGILVTYNEEDILQKASEWGMKIAAYNGVLG